MDVMIVFIVIFTLGVLSISFLVIFAEMIDFESYSWYDLFLFVCDNRIS